MKLELKRVGFSDTYTIGKLYLDGVYFCDTIEDKDRGLLQTMSKSEIEKIKIKGVTAIPKGTYNINMDRISPRFSKVKQYDFIQGKLPYLESVPGFEGILIHIGNFSKDTDGCILVGKNNIKGQVSNSTETFKQLYLKLKEAKDRKENISITIS